MGPFSLRQAESDWSEGAELRTKQWIGKIKCYVLIVSLWLRFKPQVNMLTTLHNAEFWVTTAKAILHPVYCVHPVVCVYVCAEETGRLSVGWAGCWAGDTVCKHRNFISRSFRLVTWAWGPVYPNSRISLASQTGRNNPSELGLNVPKIVNMAMQCKAHAGNGTVTSPDPFKWISGFVQYGEYTCRV